jgi:hypothetical protein
MTASNGPASSSSGARFSLRTGFGIIAAIALCLWAWHGYRQYQRVRELQDDNESLRAELRKEHGELKIDDANRDRLHAIAIPTLESMTWRWRVFVPAGRQFMINYIIEFIDDTGLPLAGSGCSLQSGEQVLTIALRKNGATGDYDWVIKCGPTTCGPSLDARRSQWIDSKPTRSSWQVSEQVNVPPGKPLEILRYRALPFGTTGAPMPADGILVWISESK